MSCPDLAGAPSREATRHCITFATSRALAYVSVLELGAVWERTLRRARVPVKYSQGFNPRPRMHFAAPLPVGCGSEADLLDVSLSVAWTPEAVIRALQGVTPPHLAVIAVAAVADDDPALSEQLIAAEYRVRLQAEDRTALSAAVDQLLAEDSLPLPRRGRRHRGKSYDLRPLIQTLEVSPAPAAAWAELRMRLAARPGATGRPDEVLKALGWDDAPRRCTRIRLILKPDQTVERPRLLRGEDETMSSCTLKGLGDNR